MKNKILSSSRTIFLFGLLCLVLYPGLVLAVDLEKKITNSIISDIIRKSTSSVSTSDIEIKVKHEKAGFRTTEKAEKKTKIPLEGKEKLIKKIIEPFGEEDVFVKESEILPSEGGPPSEEVETKQELEELPSVGGPPSVEEWGMEPFGEEGVLTEELAEIPTVEEWEMGPLEEDEESGVMPPYEAEEGAGLEMIRHPSIMEPEGIEEEIPQVIKDLEGLGREKGVGVSSRVLTPSDVGLPSFLPGVEVAEAAIAVDIVDFEPINAGERFSADVGKLYCYSRMIGAEVDTYINHQWSYNNMMLKREKIKIDGPDKKIFTAMSIDPERVGEWRVDILNERGDSLDTLRFNVGVEEEDIMEYERTFPLDDSGQLDIIEEEGPLVVEGIIARGIKEGEPDGAGEVFEPTVGRLYCYTRAHGLTAPTMLYHNWYYEGKRIKLISLDIPLDDPRAVSFMDLQQGWVGDWRVDILNSREKLIKSLNFNVGYHEEMTEPVSLRDTGFLPVEPPVEPMLEMEQVVPARELKPFSPPLFELRVIEGVIAQNVKNLKPSGVSDLFSPSVGRVYCFTRIQGAEGPTRVYHAWYFKDELVSLVPLNVISPDFKTFSYTTISPDMTGKWRVEVKGEGREIMDVIYFNIESQKKRERVSIVSAIPKKIEKKKVDYPKADNIRISYGALARSVKRLEPIGVGDIFHSGVGRIYCFTRISGVHKKQEIRHVWYYKGQVMSEIPLLITSQDFRTYSFKTISPVWIGQWRVDVVNSKGIVLDSFKFSIVK